MEYISELPEKFLKVFRGSLRTESIALQSQKYIIQTAQKEIIGETTHYTQ